MAAYRYGLNDLKIAAWNGENSYGAAVDIDAAEAFTVEVVVQADQLEGDDVIKDTIAKITSATATLRYGDVSLAVLERLLGGTLSSGSGYDRLKVGQNDAPYFSICGRLKGSAGGDTHIWLPKCRLSGNLSYAARQNSYLIPEAEITAVHEGDANGVIVIKRHDALTPVSIPLA